MPAATSDLESFLKRQDAAALAGILLELANEHKEVKTRLERFQLAHQPKKLAAAFRKTITSLRRSNKFISYRESGEFARTLENWLTQVNNELVPIDPAAALDLFRFFIETDSNLIERTDDSGGEIGGVIRQACQLWLSAAAQCASQAKLPANQWSEELLDLFESDHYGLREKMLRNANQLLDEPALRSLVAHFEARMSAVLGASKVGASLPYEVYKYSAALSLLSEALGDPDVRVRGVLMYSPLPNELQRASFVEAYLEAGRPNDALPWLEGLWERDESARLRLKSAALAQLGRNTDSAHIRQGIFEKTLSVFDLQLWLEALPEAGHPEAFGIARRLALTDHDPERAASLLLEIGDVEAAEAVLIAVPDKVQATSYHSLLQMAKDFREHQRHRGETLVYRALLTAILERSWAKAYGHAAQYWMRLHDIAAVGANLLPLESHLSFVASVRLKHARKPAFWGRVAALSGPGPR